MKPSTTFVHVPKHAQTGSLASRVVHIQSPRPDTWIQAGDLPPSASTLGIELPWFGIQFKPLGVRRRVTIELGLVDTRGRVGVVRLSSHKVGGHHVYSHTHLLTDDRPSRRSTPSANPHSYTSH